MVLSLKLKFKQVFGDGTARLFTSAFVTFMEAQEQQLCPTYILFCVNSANSRKIQKVLPVADM